MARTRNADKFDAQRQALLEAAGTCFVRLGFHGASIADICAEAGGISPGRLYHYFPSKQAIVEAMVREERAEMASLFALTSMEDDPMRGLERLIERMILVGCGHDYGLLAAEVIGESFRNAEVGRLIRFAERDMRERLIAALADARRSAVDNARPTWAEKDDDRLARGLTLIVDGATVRALLEPTAIKALAREAGELARLLLTAAARP